MSSLLTSEIFRVFVNTLTPDDKYFLVKCRFSNNKFKRFYLKKEKLFFDLLLHFWNVHEI